MAKIPKYVRKLVGDDVPPEDKDAVAHALTRLRETDARTVRRGFRPASEILRICPWKSAQIVIVLVEGRRGQQLSWAQSVGEKRALLRLAGEDDRVLAGWPGEWRQDLFELTPEDRKAVLDMLGAG